MSRARILPPQFPTTDGGGADFESMCNLRLTAAPPNSVFDDSAYQVFSGDSHFQLTGIHIVSTIHPLD